MNHVMKLQGLVMGLVVLLVAGAGLPAAGQTQWDLSFSTNADMRSQIIKDFDSGGSFPAGFYRIEYISGAGDYHGVGVNPNPSAPSNTYNLGTFSAMSGVADTKMGVICRAVYLEETDNVPPPRGWSSVAEVENAAFGTGKTSIEFKHAGGQIGVQNSDAPGTYWNNYVPAGGAITFRLFKLSDVEKYELKMLVAKSTTNNKEAEDGSTAQSEKSEGYQVEDQSEWLITCKVPGGLKDEEVEFNFGAIFKGVSKNAVKIYDDGGNELSGKLIRWPIEQGTKTFTIHARTSLSAELQLHVVDESDANKTQINKATETVSGTTDVPVCPAYTDLTIGGCGCGSSCSGESSADPGCLRLQIGIGGVGFDEGGGYLLLLSRRPSDMLYKPGSLQFFLNDRLTAADGFTADGDKITPSETSDADWGEAVLTLHVDGYGYDIDFYESKDGTLANSPYRTLTVENLNGATSNDELYITETIELDASTAPKVRMWHFEWTGASAGETDDGSWILTEGEATGAAGLAGDTILRITERAEVWNGAGDEVTETVTIKESDNTVVSKSEEVWRVFDWGRERISMTRDPDSGDALKEVWTYYDDLSGDGEDNYGRLESYQSKTGYWERYEYDSDGNLAKTMRQHEGEALALGTAFATEAADNIVEEYVEDDSVSVTFGGGAKTVRVEKWQIKVEGTVERTWYEIYVDEPDSTISGCTEEWMVRPVLKDPENGTTLAAVIEDVLDGTDTTSIVTKSWHWEDGAPGIGDNEPHDVRAMQSADGQITVYERTVATDERTTVVKRGFSDDSLVSILSGAGGADIEYGTKTTSVTDARGNMVLTKQEKISESDNSGAWFITSLMKVGVDINGDPETDEFGRPTVTAYFFGEDASDEAATPGSGTAAYDTRLTYGCCGGGEEEIRTGRDGVQTRTLEDVLGRTAYTIRWANAASPLYSVNEYDAAGRVIASGISTDNDLDDPEDLKSSRTYDKAGRMTSATDEEGRKSYMTYRRVTTTGGTYAGTGVFYWETRAYGNDDDVPVSVTWTDSHGRTVLSYTGSGTWAGTPTGTETLTEHTRSTSIYDWDNRMTEGRAYFDIASLAKDAPGTPGTNYIVTGTTEYDALGRGFRSTDASGNITQSVYEDGTGRSIKTLIGVDVSDLHTVSRAYYNKFVGSAPTGDDRPWPTRVYTVKPGLDAAPDDSDLDDASPTLTDYTYTQTVEEHSVDATKDYLTARKMWSRPEHAPWSYSESDEQGRSVASYATKNGDATYLLTKSATSYYADSPTPAGSAAKPQYAEQFTVTGGSAGTNKTRSTYYYDDAGRQVKAETTGRGYSKTEYDAYGRTKRSVFASAEGANTDADAFTDDIILTESVPTYDKSGRVTGTVTYERAHDAPGSTTGLLSAAAADQSRASYSYTWYDDNGRQTHSANLGTDSSYSYVAGTPPTLTPGTGGTDDVLASKVEYDAAGRTYLSTDNLGRQSRVFFDDLGRTTHSVENWDGVLTTPDAPGSRDADVNRITKNIYDNSATGGGARIETVAIDPDGNGNTSDNQFTLYIHSGEVDASERGPIPVNGRSIAIVMPDADDGSGDRVEAIDEINSGGEVFGDFKFTAYYANGQVKQTTDQRGVQKNRFYTDEGWLDYTTVTEAIGNTWTATGDLRMYYHYGDAGEIIAIQSYIDDNVAIYTSEIYYAYDGFYNVITETQKQYLSSAQTISYAYDATTSSNVYTKAYRLDTITYPNGRVIQLNYDGHNGIDDAIGRANAIKEDADSTDIVSYTYLGSGRMARKEYPFSSGGVRLDMLDESGEGSDANDDYEVSWDAFGRPIRYQWEQYDASGDAVSGGDLVHIAHGYDRNSNRLYDERIDSPSYSKVFTRDKLDRIVSDETGNIESDQSGIKDNWITGGAEYELNQLGSILGVDPADESKDNVTRYTYNDANELTLFESKGDPRRKPLFADDFSNSATASNWELPSGHSDAFAIDSGGNDKFTFTTVSQDTYNGVTEYEACAIVLWKDSTDIGLVRFAGDDVKADSSSQVGFVFGYKSPTEYYVAVNDRAFGSDAASVYHFSISGSTATKTFIGSVERIRNLDRFGVLDLKAVFGADDVPVGRIGLWSNSTAGELGTAIAFAADKAPTWNTRWQDPTSIDTPFTTETQMLPSSDELRVYLDLKTQNEQLDRAAILIKGLTVQKFEVTYKVTLSNKQAQPMLIFNAEAHDYFARIGIRPIAKQAHYHNINRDNVYNQSKTTYGSVIPSVVDGDVLWLRYICDGSSIEGHVQKTTTKPSEGSWGTATKFVESTTIPNFGGGGIGISMREASNYTVDDFTVKSDPDGDGNYDKVELLDSFTLDESDGNYGDHATEHDAAGNLTFDGNKKYTYDAYNRLVKVENAFKDPGYTPSGGSAGDLEVGSTVAEYAYDSAGRRIRKDAYVGGILDNVEHFYYVGHSLVETRNGSDQVLQQHVWDNLAGQYIDSLAQVANNTNPGIGVGEDNTVDQFLYALQDQQFNILAIVDDTGEIVERYEYTLYGERTIYRANSVVLTNSAYNMSCGFQGLMHDEATGLVYNRSRMLNPRLKRFNQRDPLGYPDGMNTYAAYHVMRGGVDPMGLQVSNGPFSLHKGIEPQGFNWDITMPLDWDYQLHGSIRGIPFSPLHAMMDSAHINHNVQQANFHRVIINENVASQSALSLGKSNIRTISSVGGTNMQSQWDAISSITVNSIIAGVDDNFMKKYIDGDCNICIEVRLEHQISRHIAQTLTEKYKKLYDPIMVGGVQVGGIPVPIWNVNREDPAFSTTQNSGLRSRILAKNITFPNRRPGTIVWTRSTCSSKSEIFAEWSYRSSFRMSSKLEWMTDMTTGMQTNARGAAYTSKNTVVDVTFKIHN